MPLIEAFEVCGNASGCQPWYIKETALSLEWKFVTSLGRCDDASISRITA